VRKTLSRMEMAYSDEGTGPALVFIHGLGGRASNWFYQQQYYKAQYRIICLDLPGHGSSTGIELPFRHFPETVLDLLDELGVTRFALVGLSTGARVAFTIAAIRQQAVVCLTAINTFVNLTPSDRTARYAIYELLLAHDYGQRWADALLREMSISGDSVIARGFRRAAAANDPAFIHRIFHEMVSYSQNDELALVACPVQLIRGSLDKFVPRSCADDLSSRLKKVHIDTLHGLGHLPYLEAPNRFNETLDRFLQSSVISWKG